MVATDIQHTRASLGFDIYILAILIVLSNFGRTYDIVVFISYRRRSKAFCNHGWKTLFILVASFGCNTCDQLQWIGFQYIDCLNPVLNETIMIFDSYFVSLHARMGRNRASRRATAQNLLMPK